MPKWVWKLLNLAVCKWNEDFRAKISGLNQGDLGFLDIKFPDSMVNWPQYCFKASNGPFMPVEKTKKSTNRAIFTLNMAF